MRVNQSTEIEIGLWKYCVHHKRRLSLELVTERKMTYIEICACEHSSVSWIFCSLTHIPQADTTYMLPLEMKVRLR